jgi:hypothetical protein
VSHRLAIGATGQHNQIWDGALHSLPCWLLACGVPFGVSALSSGVVEWPVDAESDVYRIIVSD